MNFRRYRTALVACFLSISGIINGQVCPPALNIDASAMGKALTDLCLGDDADLEATPDLTGQTNPTYQWQIGTEVPAPAGPSQQFTVPNLQGQVVISCTYLSNECTTPLIETRVLDINLPEVDAGEDQLITLGESAVLDGSGEGSFHWLPADSLFSDPFGPNPTVTPVGNTVYTLEVTDALGCTNTDQVVVQASPCGTDSENSYYLLTPNGDGEHDTWAMAGLAPSSNCKIYVHDRSGQKVFSSVGYEEWDGTWAGMKSPPGAYYYRVDISEGNSTVTCSGLINVVY